jgi:hypothetical protein
MDDLDIIRKVRKEHRRLREIRAQLEAAVARSADEDPDQWLHDVRTAFESFRAHLVHRVALEQIGGFLDVVCKRRPTLTPQVEHLKSSHNRMIEMGGTTLSKLRELCSDKESLNQAALLVELMLSEVEHHEKTESLLVSFVFTQDIGGGD